MLFLSFGGETLDLLREWWKVRPSRHDAGPPEERWLFPGAKRCNDGHLGLTSDHTAC
jgi:hypothetical protein